MDQVTVSRELLRQVLNNLHGSNLCSINSMSSRHEARRLIDVSITALRTALEQPVQEPVAWAYLFDDDGSLCQTFDTQDEAEKWAASSDNLWSGFIAPLYTAPQAQEKP